MKKLFTLLLWIIGFQLIGAGLGFVTQSNMYPWYETLTKSSLTPPPIVFSVVWSSLYVLLAICGYFIWQQRQQIAGRLPLYFFSIQMVMNWLWTFLFFSFHLISFSFIWIIGIIIFTALTYHYTNQKLVRGLLIPYMLWLLFAAFLNGYIAFSV